MFLIIWLMMIEQEQKKTRCLWLTLLKPFLFFFSMIEFLLTVFQSNGCPIRGVVPYAIGDPISNSNEPNIGAGENAGNIFLQTRKLFCS